MALFASLKPYQSYIYALVTGYGLMGVNMIVQLLLIPFYLRHLDSYQFGVLMMILSFFNFASLGISWMSSGGLRVMGEYYASQDQDNFHQSYIVARISYILYASLIAAVMVLAAFFWVDGLFHPPSAESRSIITEALCYAAVYFVIMYDFSSARVPIIATKRQAVSNMLQIAAVLLFVCLVVVMLSRGGGLKDVFISLIVSNMTMTLVTQYYLKKAHVVDGRLRFNPSRQLPILKRLMGRMGASYFIFGIVSTVLQADIMIVGLIGGPKAAAAFTLVWKIAEVIVQLIAKIPEHLSPYLIALDAQRRTEELRHLLIRLYPALLVISLAAAVTYAMGGEWIVTWWVGPKNVIQDKHIYLLAGGAIFWLAITKLPLVIALATARLRLLLVATFVELSCKLLLLYCLFPVVGFSAVLIAINAVHALGVAVLYFMIVYSYVHKH